MVHSLEPFTDAEPPRTSTPQRRHRWIGATIVLVVAGGALWWYLQKHQSAFPVQSDSRQSAPAVRVSVQSVAPTTSPQSLEVTGTVHAELEAPIATKVIARVKNVLVKEGDRVRRGQPLILLDARDLDASLSQANANVRAASAGYDNARAAARMEASLSTARIAEAQSKIAQSEAAFQAATARLELVQAGPRRQEREQAVLAVSQAKSTLTLAESSLKRMASLYREGAISAQQYDQYKSQFEVARSQFETAQQGKSITDEGSRAEDIRAAQQAVRQAHAAVQEADAGLNSAQAGAMQTEVRKQEVKGARAQIDQSQASLQLAKVTRDYAVITAPFDGIIAKRLADPGAMAGPGVLLLTVQGGALRLEAILPESVLVSVRKGAAVPVHFDALRNRALTGRVVEIAPQGDASSHTFVVKIDLPLGSRASAGMFGRARFATGTESHLLVPASSLWEREGLHFLYVVDENHVARLRMVTVGDPVAARPAWGERIPVLSGLNSGERIITTNKERVKDGSPVIEGSR